MSASDIEGGIPLEDLMVFSEDPHNGACELKFLAFNTEVSLLGCSTPSRCRQAFRAAMECCRAYEKLFSRTLERSDVSRLNEANGSMVRLDPRTAELLERGLAYCAISEGAFDITIGPVIELWDFNRGTVPEQALLAERAKHVDWRAVELTSASGFPCARLRDPRASVDVGGIAKGWIADRLVELLVRFGMQDFVVNLGGNVAVRGSRPGGGPWRVGVRDPWDSSKSKAVILMQEGSAVTSGITERCFRKDGVLYHHILDPKSGMPVQTDAMSATVVARDSLDAEGLSTTLLSLGVERGLEFALSRPEIVQVVFVGADGEIVMLH